MLLLEISYHGKGSCSVLLEREAMLKKERDDMESSCSKAYLPSDCDHMSASSQHNIEQSIDPAESSQAQPTKTKTKTKKTPNQCCLKSLGFGMCCYAAIDN
jgi:hypothetical protein